VTGKEGMGHGDFKLLAMLGAWGGWQILPLTILLSSLVGAVLGLIMLRLRNADTATPIPFGPYLAIAGWIALLWGETITSRYLQLAGFYAGSTSATGSSHFEAQANRPLPSPVPPAGEGWTALPL